MATRFDRMSRPARVEDRVDEDVLHDELFDPTSTALAAGAPTALASSPAAYLSHAPPEALTQASATWLGLVFALSYVALPSTFAMLGIGGGSLFFWPQFPAFALAAVVVALSVAITRPAVRLDKIDAGPVAAAMGGGLMGWALVQGLFTPLAAVPTVAFGTLVLGNIVEMALLGAMFGSFTKHPGQAFSMAAGFQVLIGWLSIMFLLFL